MLESVTLNVINTQPFTVCYKLYVSMTWIRLDDSKGKTGRSFKNKLDGHLIELSEFSLKSSVYVDWYLTDGFIEKRLNGPEPGRSKRFSY